MAQIIFFPTQVFHVHTNTVPELVCKWAGKHQVSHRFRLRSTDRACVIVQDVLLQVGPAFDHLMRSCTSSQQKMLHFLGCPVTTR